MTKLEALELRFKSDIGEGTIRNYLFRLLDTLWAEKEGFSCKRPFGNGGWDYDVYAPLIAACAIVGDLD